MRVTQGVKCIVIVRCCPYQQAMSTTYVLVALTGIALCSVDMEGMFGAKGIKNAKDRISLVVGDVMQPFPEEVQKGGVDTLMMKHFLSAFNDKDAALILKHCSQVLAPEGKILLLQVSKTSP